MILKKEIDMYNKKKKALRKTFAREIFGFFFCFIISIVTDFLLFSARRLNKKVLGIAQNKYNQYLLGF
jgi:hypothetical protein